jgi:hypothetical protein
MGIADFSDLYQEPQYLRYSTENLLISVNFLANEKTFSISNYGVYRNSLGVCQNPCFIFDSSPGDKLSSFSLFIKILEQFNKIVLILTYSWS